MNVDHIAVKVSDINDSCEWYKKNLQGEIIHKDDTWAMIQCSGIKIALVASDNHESHIGFSLSNISDMPCTKDKIKVHRDGSSYYYGSDPDGNIIEWVVYPEAE
jgi:catechol-2,3-dioxygenase